MRPHFLLARAKQKVPVCSKHSSFSQSEREKHRKREREGERERERERKRQREGEREGERGRERKRYAEYGCIIFIFKRNDGCLGTF